MQKTDHPFLAPLVIAGLGTVILLALWLRHGFMIFDIAMGDESYYFGLGKNLTFDLIRRNHMNWGPLYILYYKLMSGLSANPIDDYMIAGLVIAAASALCLALAAAVLSGSAALALLAGGVFVALNALLMGPRVSLAAVAVMSLGLAAAARMRTVFGRCAVLASFAYALCYIRPEFVIAFYAFAAGSLLLLAHGLYRDRRSLKISEYKAGLALLAGIAVLAVIWDMPSLGASGRVFGAFTDHFAWRYAARTHPSQNFVLVRDQIMALYFPGAKTLPEAFASAPANVLMFVTDNLKGLGALMLSALTRASLELRGNAICFAAGTVLIISSLLFLLLRRNPGESHRVGRQNLSLVVAILTFMVPPALMLVLIYPREHYWVILLALLLLLASVLHDRRKPTLSIRAQLATSAAMLLGLALALKPAPQLPLVQASLFRDFQQVPGVKVLFEMNQGICVYYIPNCLTVVPAQWEWGGRKPIELFFQEMNVNAVIIEPIMRSHQPLMTEPYFAALVRDPARFGFKAYPLDPHLTVLVRAEGDGPPQ